MPARDTIIDRYTAHLEPRDRRPKIRIRLEACVPKPALARRDLDGGAHGAQPTDDAAHWYAHPLEEEDIDRPAPRLVVLVHVRANRQVRDAVPVHVAKPRHGGAEGVVRKEVEREAGRLGADLVPSLSRRVVCFVLMRACRYRKGLVWEVLVMAVVETTRWWPRDYIVYVCTQSSRSYATHQHGRRRGVLQEEDVYHSRQFVLPVRAHRDIAHAVAVHWSGCG